VSTCGSRFLPCLAEPGAVPIEARQAIGVTDDLGSEAVEEVHHVRDFHVTLLHLLGLNGNKLTYFHEGRFKQPSQTGGQVIKELVA